LNAMYVDVVPNRSSPPAVLLRQAIREGKKIRKFTVANLSDWPEEQVSSLRLSLKGESLVALNQAFTIARSLPHGHVAAALGTLCRLGLERIVNRESCRERDLVVAMVVVRILEPASKLATVWGLEAETASSSSGSCLGLETVSEDEFYRAMGRGGFRREHWTSEDGGRANGEIAGSIRSGPCHSGGQSRHAYQRPHRTGLMQLRVVTAGRIRKRLSRARLAPPVCYCGNLY
jgi:hypothetical protein